MRVAIERGLAGAVSADEEPQLWAGHGPSLVRSPTNSPSRILPVFHGTARCDAVHHGWISTRLTKVERATAKGLVEGAGRTAALDISDDFIRIQRQRGVLYNLSRARPDQTSNRSS